jgi:hypothetical protein
MVQAADLWNDHDRAERWWRDRPQRETSHMQRFDLQFYFLFVHHEYRLERLAA